MRRHRLLRLLTELQLPWCSRQPYLHGGRVTSEHLRPLAPSRPVALVDDDVAEIVLRVIGREEVSRSVFGIDIQGLVGSHMDTGVLGVVASVGLFVNLCRLGAEDPLQRPQRLSAKFLPVADEQGTLEKPCIGYPLKQMDGDESLS